ncbi:aspartyl protease family protein [Chryseobacterium sp.]|uniref:aspartyl protease family protein n=1 Tax=Chryseobacterium sp. TaxID=1871047 RepID=UPI0025C564B1|nr:aspartyl protease family protein [Chryseobacterium sp.]
MGILIFSNAFSQKGIFKYGTLSPEHYKENLTFEYIKDLIFINVEINKKTYRFLVDTGAPTIISSKVKGDFKIVQQDEITDASKNTQSVNYVLIPQMNLGALTYRNFSAMRSDMELLQELNIDGILGANLIRKSIWDFDIVHHKIMISDYLNTETVKGFDFAKIKTLETGTPALTLVYFNSIKEHGIYFDTGYNGLFYLTDSIFEKVSKKKLLKKKIEGAGQVSKSAFGTEVGTTYMLPLEMKLGKHPIPTFLSDVNKDEESNLGCEWLQYYHTIISKDKFYFKSNGKKINSQFITNGINTGRDSKGLYISFLWKNSAADKKGLRLNDRILSVDQQAPDLRNPEAVKELEDKIKENKKVLLEINTKGNFIELKSEILLDTL